MKKYAQIKDGKVHWIFEHAAKSVAELYEKYFSQNDIEIIDITGLENVAEGMDATLTDGKYIFTERAPDPVDIQAETEAKASSILANAMRKQAAETIEFDDAALAVLGKAGYFDEWAADTNYTAGKRLTHNGAVYVVMQDVKSQTHQPPDAAGMLAVYRPVSVDAGGNEPDGTLDNPIPYIYGMDVCNGKYYSYNGITYLAKADMKPCVWPPDTVGLWQWQQITQMKFT